MWILSKILSEADAGPSTTPWELLLQGLTSCAREDNGHLWATKDKAQPQFFSEYLMAMHLSPVLALLHVSVSGNTLLSHRLGTL